MIANLPTSHLKDVSCLLRAKVGVRERIQERFNLQIDPSAQLISFVGRLAEQKGLSLLSGGVNYAYRSTLEDILVRHPNTQLVVAGPATQGDAASEHLCTTLRYLAQRYPGRVGTFFDYVPHTAALEIIFGSTLFLMPSRFEPGGITQLEALAAGTLVVGRNVGGISATVEHYNQDTGAGNGFLCNEYTATAFANTIHWALDSITDNRVYERLVFQAISARHSWSDRASEFLIMLRQVALGKEHASRIETLLQPS